MRGFAPDHAGARVSASPNCGARRGGRRPDALILHYTGMASGRAAAQRLCDPQAEVSAHYLVEEDGTIVQMVREADRAWHAGRACWHGEADVNSLSIGVEIVNPGHDLGYPDFPARQIDAVIALGLDIARRHAIPAARVLAHSDVAPGRKVDPGEKFPWARLAAAGLGHWVEPAPPADDTGPAAGGGGAAVAALQRDLARYGYCLAQSGRYDEGTATVVAAFQRHFRPARVDGVADGGTQATLRRLLAALPGAA